MQTLTRDNDEGKAGQRIIVIDKCWDCPFADAQKGFFIGWYVTCKLTEKEYHFDDNGMHFSTPQDCPLQLEEEYINENQLA